MDTCIRTLMEKFEYLTERLLKEKDPIMRPVVAEPSHINLIMNVRKGNFVITAHAGAGKTTLGLLLYHKARLGELSGYDVVYVNVRDLKGLHTSRLKTDQILEAIFNENSNLGEKARKAGVIYSSISRLDINCKVPLECIEYFDKRYENKKLILVIDELERGIEEVDAINFIIDWFVATRNYYDKTFMIPIKVVVMLPKVISLIRTLSEHIKQRGGESVTVFTEFRELAITSDILRDYFIKLNSTLDGALINLSRCNEFNELIKILGYMISGRFSISMLRRAISNAICRSLSPDINIETINNVKELAMVLNKALANTKLCINLEDIADPVLFGIIKGKPFRAPSPYTKGDMIDMWKGSADNLCKDLGSMTGAIRYGYQNFVCRVDVRTTGTPILWLTLAKSVGTNDIKGIVTKLIHTLSEHEELPNTIALLILLPEFTKGLIAEQKITIPIPQSKKPSTKTKYTTITVNLKARRLGNEELISLAFKGKPDLQIDSDIANNIYKELLMELKSERTWQ